jgi:hypothetical protein
LSCSRNIVRYGISKNGHNFEGGLRVYNLTEQQSVCQTTVLQETCSALNKLWEYQINSLQNFTNFGSSHGGQYCTVATMILPMKPGFFHSRRTINIFLYKSISLLLLFYQNFIEIIIDLFDKNEKLQDEKLVKFINLSCFKILSKEKWEPY